PLQPPPLPYTTLFRSVLGSVIRLPYYALGPGPASEVEPLIRVSGHQVYPSAGQLIMTTVQFVQLTPVTAIAAWLDPNRSVVSRRDRKSTRLNSSHQII